MVSARLSELVARLGGTCVPRGGARPGVGRAPRELPDVELVDVTLDSRRVAPGELFAALPGTRADGARFAGEAVGRGAPVVLSPSPLAELETEAAWTNWVHPEARSVVGRAASLVHGDPARDMAVAAVTGTNGKSTTVHLLGQLLEAEGRRPAVLGTLGYRLAGGTVHDATHTTPDAARLWRLVDEHRAAGGDALVLEASSHALDQERLAGLALDVAIFTNLGRDHLDYHLDMEAYARAKERIFSLLRPGGTAVICADDPAGERMIRAARAQGAEVITYGIGSRVDLRAEVGTVRPAGTHLFLEGMGILRTGLLFPLVGRHNVLDALAASAAVLRMGASPARVCQGLASLSPPPGRLEPVDTGTRGFRVLVDYAHTPDALESVLTTLRETLAAADDEGRGAAGRLLCLFGCGGERDRDKRPLMGEIAGRLADLVVVTSDNPRGEDPEAILADVLRGMEGAKADVRVEPDRRKAIHDILEDAAPGDVVLLAGKGHETWQWLAEERRPFDDRAVAREALA